MLRTRGSRATFALLLAVVAMAAGLVVWSAEQRRAALARDQSTASQRVDGLVQLVADLEATLRQPGPDRLRDENWIALIEKQIGLLDEATARLQPGALPGVIPAIAALENSTRALEQEVARTKQASPEEDASPTTPLGVGLSDHVSQIRRAQEGAFIEAHAGLASRSWSAIEAAVSAWAIGLAFLIWRPVVAPPTIAPPQVEPDIATAPQPAPLDPAPRLQEIDMAATAHVCRSLATLTSADRLPSLLREVASLVGARGLVIWVHSEARLVAAAWHGYDGSTVRTFGTISLAEVNPVTQAWLSGEAVAVAPTQSTPAALAIPIRGAVGGVGVLALELLRGRHADSITVSVTSILAAQLGAVVALPSTPTTLSEATPDAPDVDIARAIGA